jgi:large subunit ribosomal protein L15
MFQLNNLDKLKKDRKRVGRGGDRGGTSGRGHKGQGSRSGSKIKAFFEGGQMPLSRRLPKRGFNNIFKKDVRVLNLCDLELKFNSGDLVDKKSLYEKGIFKGKKSFFIKVLGVGELSKNLIVCVDMFSKSAKQAIEKAGGTVKLIGENVSDNSAS